MNNFKNLLEIFPKVGKKFKQDPEEGPWEGKRNKLPNTVHHTRYDGAKHMAEYEDEDSTRYAYDKLTKFNQKEDEEYDNL